MDSDTIYVGINARRNCTSRALKNKESARRAVTCHFYVTSDIQMSRGRKIPSESMLSAGRYRQFHGDTYTTNICYLGKRATKCNVDARVVAPRGNAGKARL